MNNDQYLYRHEIAEWMETSRQTIRKIILEAVRSARAQEVERSINHKVEIVDKVK